MRTPSDISFQRSLSPALLAELNARGRCVRLPNCGDVGHKALGNWYTTRLNALGNPAKHYGDPGSARFGIAQTGATKQFRG